MALWFPAFPMIVTSAGSTYSRRSAPDVGAEATMDTGSILPRGSLMKAAVLFGLSALSMCMAAFAVTPATIRVGTSTQFRKSRCARWASNASTADER